jgi:hypothetical protein
MKKLINVIFLICTILVLNDSLYAQTNPEYEVVITRIKPLATTNICTSEGTYASLDITLIYSFAPPSSVSGTFDISKEVQIFYVKDNPYPFVHTALGKDAASATRWSDEWHHTWHEGLLSNKIEKSINDACRRTLSAEYTMTITKPPIAQSARFSSYSDLPYACLDENPEIFVDYYYGDLQIQNRNGEWQELFNLDGSYMNHYYPPEVINQYVDYGQPIIFRVKSAPYHDGTVYYDYCPDTLYIFPKFQFPTGKDLIIEQLVCSGGNTTIKIPYEGTTNYNFTIKNLTGKNYVYGGINGDKVTKTNTHYIITDNIPVGSDTLIVEYGAFDGESPCHFRQAFTVPEIPAFTIGAASYTNYTDNAGNQVQIRKKGEKAQVSFPITGSREQNVTIHAGSIDSTKTLTSMTTSVIDGSTYYNGTVSIYLPAGTYNTIYVDNDSGCRVDYPAGISLNEPAAITFTATRTNPSCNSANLISGNINGSIVLSAINGGIGNYTYTIDNGSPVNITGNSETLSGLPAKSYSITVSDSYGNTLTKTVTIIAPAAITATTSTVPPSLWCLTDGSVTVNASGGTGQYSYSKVNQPSGFNTNPVLSGYSSGTDNVYVQDANHCICSFPVTISSTNQLTVVSKTETAPVCSGDDDGSLTLVMRNRQGTLSVSYAPVPNDRIVINGNTITLAGMESGEYYCTVRETNNDSSCDLDIPFTIPEKQTISIIPVITPVSDKGSATGRIDVSVSGGNGPAYTLYIYDSAGTQLQEHTSAGPFTLSGLTGASSDGGKLYRIEVLDSKNCSRTLEVRVPEPADALQLQASLTRPVSCHDAGDAVVTLTAEGGWGTYQYSRDNATWTTNPVFSGLAAGDYTFYVKDKYAGSCPVAITLQNPLPLTIVRESLSPVLCKGESTGQIRYRISGGTYPYTLSPQRGNITQSIQEDDTLITVSGLPAGNYTFTVKDSRNCSAVAAQETLTEPAKLQLSAPNITHTSCELPNGSLTAKASGGVTPYTYTLTGVGFSYSQTQTWDATETASFSDIPAATYRLTVTDSNGCSVQSTLLTVDPSTSPSVNNVMIRDAVCFGENNGWVEVIPLSGDAPVASYTMYNDDASYRQNNTTGIFENLYAGDYKIDIYDAAGCQSNVPYPVTVREPEALSIVVDTILPAVSKGAKEGKIFFRIQGGNSNSKTVWLLNAEGEEIDNLSGVNGFLLSFTTYAGLYRLEVEDAKACSFITGELEVSEPADSLRLVVRDVHDALCKSQTGSIVVEGTGGWGGYRYKRAAEEQFSSLNRFDNLYPGNYLITVTDKLGATCSKTITVYEPQDSLQAEVIDLLPPTCGSNGNLSIRLSGGTPPYKMYEGSDTLFCSGPQTVEWPGLTSSPVLLHLTDANGCRFELEASLPETSLLSIENLETTIPDVPGASDGAIRAMVSGGMEPYSYHWTAVGINPRVYPAGDYPVLDQIPSGYYHLEVTDAGGCSVEDQIYLADPGDIQFTLLETGHETALEAADGYAVLYAGNSLIAYTVISPQFAVSTYSPTDSDSHFFVRNDTVFLQNLSGGAWFVYGENTDGQHAVAEFEILPYPAFVFTNTIVTPVSKPGDSNGKIQVEVQGGGGDNRFTWTDAAGALLTASTNAYSTVLTAIPAGFYTVQVEDRYSNRLTKTVEVPEPEQALQLSIIEQQNQSCKTAQDAYIVLAASGGWGDYQFRHESEIYFHNGSSFSGLTTGDHSFYGIDKLGTVCHLPVTITEPEYLHASVAFVDSVKCKDAADGRIVFDITGGTAPYSFREPEIGFWTEGMEALNLSAGWHTFLFTDSHFCEGQDTLTVYVPEPDSLLFKTIEVIHTTCNEDNGRITVGLQGGTRPYSYRWLDFYGRETGNDSTITGLKQNGLYHLEVSDYNGCTLQLEQLIQPSTLPYILGVETTGVLCYGDTTGTARVTGVVAAEPYAPYTLTWSNGDTGEYSNRFGKGQHSVTIADDNGCSTTYYFDIDQPDSLRLLISEVREPNCFGYNDGYIHTETLGGAGNYTYLWSTGDTTPNKDGLTQGDYWVRVTDENGCTDEKQIHLNEPDSLTIDLGEDILMCPGNTHVLDGQEYVSHRWFTTEGDISTERYLQVTKEGHYFLEAKAPDGCSAWGDISVLIGNNALKADLLLASEAAVGDTLVIFELSNMPLDSLKWHYDPKVFERIETNDDYNELPYVLQLRCLQTGLYNIELDAYSGGCYAPATKQVEVMEAGDENPDDWWKNSQPLIQSLTQYPNPTNGLFTVELALREAAEVRLVLFEVASGICVNQRTEQGADSYWLNYNLQHLNSGVYVLIVTADNERRQLKIIIE